MSSSDEDESDYGPPPETEPEPEVQGVQKQDKPKKKKASSQKLEALKKAREAKKKKTKNCSSNHCKDLVQFFNNCCESASEMFGLDYVPPEIVFLNFLDIDLAPKAVSSVILKDKDLVDKLITEITFSLSDVDISMLSLLEEEISNSLLTANNESKKLEMFKDNEVLSQFAENLNIKASNNKFDKIVDFDDKISEIKKPNKVINIIGCIIDTKLSIKDIIRINTKFIIHKKIELNFKKTKK